jgi:hypothetical protein
LAPDKSCLSTTTLPTNEVGSVDGGAVIEFKSPSSRQHLPQLAAQEAALFGVKGLETDSHGAH